MLSETDAKLFKSTVAFIIHNEMAHKDLRKQTRDSLLHWTKARTDLLVNKPLERN